ncbi:HutD family protein [Rhodanobacter umsongensis]|uniref:HutD family protein n=1 Tax=Rhodanobacter umsongensis TaxID=633153 RepID=A0ABW0JKB3_9GAMM
MIIRLSDCPPQPWKNGLGNTRQIAVHPAEAGADDFVWRVSIAGVDSNAPFSAFPGIDRQIALLDGDGFTMTLDEDCIHSLTTPFAPFAFAGEANVAVSLVGGPTRDFNLMVRRARASGEIQVWAEPGSYLPDPAIVLVHAARGDIDTPEGVLHAGDTWLTAGPARGDHITLRDRAVALAIRIARKD